MKRFGPILGIFLLGLTGLTGCRLVLPEHPYYSVHEIELLLPEASERWVYFYGDPMVVELDGEPVRLTVPDGEPSPWAIPGALWVNGMPLWREVLPPTRPQVKASYDPLTRSYTIRTEVELLGTWYFDGDVWWRLSGPLAAGAQVVRLPEEHPFRPKSLTPDEARVVRRELELRSRGKPLVLFERAAPVHTPYRFTPPPWLHRLASLRAQRDLPYAEVPLRRWKVLDSGDYAAYRGRSPFAYLACSPEGLAELWDLAYGNRLPRPKPPQLAPGHCLAGFFWGLKPTGGYQVKLRSGRVDSNRAVFTLELSTPSPGVGTTQALTSPFIIIETAAPVREVRFYDLDGKLLARALAR